MSRLCYFKWYLDLLPTVSLRRFPLSSAFCSGGLYSLLLRVAPGLFFVDSPIRLFLNRPSIGIATFQAGVRPTEANGIKSVVARISSAPRDICPEVFDGLGLRAAR